MAGPYTFKLEADELLTEAWERIGLNPEVLTDSHARSALRSLQLAMVDWSNADLQLWQVERLTVPLAAGAGALATPAGTTDVLEAVLALPGGGGDTPLAPLGRVEWMSLPDKARRGRPASYWVERVLETPVLHLWPVPEAACSLAYSRIRLPSDLSSLSGAPDAPVLWQDALAAELAARLAQKWAFDRLPALRAAAAAAYARANRENRERVPFRLSPRV